MEMRWLRRASRMRRSQSLLIGGVAVLLALAVHAQAVGGEPGDEIRVLRVDDMINPITERYVTRGIEEASASGAALLLVELDTPGGLLDSTQRITSALLVSDVPVDWLSMGAPANPSAATRLQRTRVVRRG